MKYAASIGVFFLLPVAPAMAGPFGTLQTLLTAPVGGYTTRGLALASILFSTIMFCSIVVRLGRLGWEGKGDFSGWHSSLGDLVWNVMLPGYATMFGANVFLPVMPDIINYISGQITGQPGTADPDAIFMLGPKTAMELIGSAIHPLTTAPLSIGGFTIPVPNFGLDVVWMTAINVGFAWFAAVIVCLSLTYVAFEMVATTAGGLWAIAYNSVAVGFSAAGATKDTAGRYIGACWMILMNIVGIVAYAVVVAEFFGAVPFHAGLLNAGTFLYTIFVVLAVAFAAAAGAKRVAHVGEAMYAGGAFVTTEHTANEAMQGPRMIGRAAMLAARSMG